MSERRDWRELAAGYALGILDDEERAAFQAHLAADDVDRQELRELQAVAGILGETVPVADPPASLRERVLGEARAGAAHTPTERAAVRPPRPKVEPAARSRRRAPARRRPAADPGLSPFSRWVRLAAAAVVVLALALLYANERQRATTLEQQLSELAGELQQERALARSRGLALDALQGPDVVMAALAAPDAAPAARVFWNRQQNVAVVTAFNLPGAPAGRTYQLWGIDTAAGTNPVSLGVFDTADDRAALTIEVPAGTTFDLAAVTEEPAGGSPQPTTQPFLVGSFAGN